MMTKRIFTSVLFIVALSSCASKNDSNLYSEVTDPTARDIFNYPIQQIKVEGIGIVKKGDTLTHKTMGKGLVEMLFKRNGYVWVAFMIDGTGTLVLLDSEYFESIK